MKRLNFNNTEYERYLCSRAEVNGFILKNISDYEVIGVTPKGIIVEFKRRKCS